MNNENENVMNDGQKPVSEEMDFFAAEKEARRVSGSNREEWENRSAGSRQRGPAGRYQGLLGGKNGHKSKASPHENKEKAKAEDLKAPAPEPEITRAPAEETDLEVLLDSEPVQAPSAEDPEESELLRALMEDPEPGDTFSPADMAAFLIASQQSGRDSKEDLAAALLRSAGEEDPSDQALFDRLDAQNQSAAFSAVPPVADDAMFIEPEEDYDDDVEYDDDDDDDDDLPPRRKKRGGLIAAVIAALLCVGVLGSAFAVSRRSTIFPRVSIHGENVSAMTLSEAEDVVKKSGWDGPDAVVLKAELPASVDLEVKAKDVGWTATAKEAAQAAYDYGRDGNLFTNFVNYVRTSFHGHEIADDLTQETNDSALKAMVKKAVDKANDAMTEGDMEIDTEDKVLRIVKGGDLLMVEADEVYDRVAEALEKGDREISCIKQLDEDADVPDVDLEKVHDEICGEPENASYDTEKKEIVEGKPGIEFDVKEAKRLWEDAKVGDLVEIPLEVTEPEFKKENVTELFADKLASKTTSLSGSSANRINNITLAAQKINGVIIEPGKSFSYNNTVGQRTAARGFREAGAYVNGQVVNEVGGGICQVSSTLYYCTLYSNLKITARTNHYFPVGYIESGLDATVSWGAPDFRFENDRTFPVKIIAYVSNGAVTVEIWGTNVDGTTVRMDSTSSGMTTTTYRNVYDKDGNLLTRTQEAVSVYHSHDETPAATPKPVVTPTPVQPTPPPVQPTPTPAPVEPTPPPVEPTPDVPVDPEVPPEGGE